MARNELSSSGIAEDLIRAFVQVGCAEVHTKTLLEKATAQMENGLIDLSDHELVQKQIDHINDLTDEINELAELRRGMMRYLHKMYPDGDKDYWCLVKHLGISAYCAFEVYQASDDDPDLLNLALEANKRFTKALTHFLGTEVSECAACLSDYLSGTNDALEKGVKDGMG